MFEKLKALDAAIHDTVVSNLQLTSQLEEARRSAEICVGATAAQFGTELRLREVDHEQTLEAVVARYAEKEAIRAHGTATLAGNAPAAQVNREIQDGVEPATFAQVTEQGRRRTRGDRPPADRAAARSKSRTARRTRLLAESRNEEYRPAFVIQSADGAKASDTSAGIWKKVMSKRVIPRCQTITTNQGKVIIKPLNKETADVLKSLSLESNELQEEPLM